MHCPSEFGHGTNPRISNVKNADGWLQASVYGKCIVADYNSVHKDKCAAEFMKLKECYLVRNVAARLPPFK